jgi:hypothetical protein
LELVLTLDPVSHLDKKMCYKKRIHAWTIVSILYI